MAKKNIQRFYTKVRQEGSAGATRGKVSVAFCEAMGANDGDTIEMEVSNGVLIGGHVMSKREVREMESEQKAQAKEAAKVKKVAKSSAPAKKKAKKTKPVVKRKSSVDVDSEAPKKTKKGKGKVKASKHRKTKVSYDSDPPVKKKGKKKGKKVKRSS